MGKKARIIGIRITTLLEQRADVLKAMAVVGDTEAEIKLRFLATLQDEIESVLVEVEE